MEHPLIDACNGAATYTVCIHHTCADRGPTQAYVYVGTCNSSVYAEAMAVGFLLATDRYAHITRITVSHNVLCEGNVGS